MNEIKLCVITKEWLAEGVCRLGLADPGGRRLPDWTPGSHIDLVLPTGVTRQFSLCGDRWNPLSYEVAVLKEPGGRGGSAYVHDVLEVGDPVGVGGPRNNFPLVPADHYLFIAGGIGITPLLPMVQQADLLGTPWSLLYGGRSRSSMAFLDQLEGYGERIRVRPQDEFGHLDLDEALHSLPEGSKVYCCGPPPLLDALAERTRERPLGTTRVERFVAKDFGPPERDAAFEVLCVRSDVTLSVPPRMSVLDALGDAGINLLSSCRQGVCGTCEVAVLGGLPDHRDSLLDDGERDAGDCMFVCVSRSRSDRLVLDL